MESQPYGFLGEQPATDVTVDALRRVSLFRDLGQDYLYGIARHARQVQSEPGEVLVREGEPGQQLIVILEGNVRIERNGQTVARMQDGDFFGEMALLDGQTRSATVIADSPASLVVLDKVMFDSLLDADPTLTRKLLLAVVTRLRERGETDVE